MISSSSSTASSAPATSLKVTWGMSLLTSLALDLPNCMTLEPPPCIRESRNQNRTPSNSTGTSREKSPENQLFSIGWSVKPPDGLESVTALTTSWARALTK